MGEESEERKAHYGRCLKSSCPSFCTRGLVFKMPKTGRKARQKGQRNKTRQDGFNRNFIN